MSEKLIPQNVEAEKAVLGSILIAQNNFATLEQLNSILQPSDFYRIAHREIYLAMINMYKINKNIDTITLIEKLQAINKLEDVGGIAYITELANTVPSYRNIKYYADIVKDKAVRRELIYACDKIKELAYNGDDFQNVLEEAERIILDVSKNHMAIGELVNPSDIVFETIQNIENRYNNHESGLMSGLDTGYENINKLTGGLQKSDLIILAARPSMGKTALALNIAIKTALKNNPVVFFSLEMSNTQLTERIISTYNCISTNNMRLGTLDSKEWNRIITAGDKLAQTPLYIDDMPYLTIEKLKSKARQYKKQKNIKLIIIDYLQLMSTGEKKENRQNEISKISRELKQLARELDIPIIALSQLSRGVEARQDKRPMLSDLRDSGAIEQDADIVMLLYRDNYYNNTSDDTTELIFAKHRNGSIGTIKLRFRASICRFEEIK